MKKGNGRSFNFNKGAISKLLFLIVFLSALSLYADKVPMFDYRSDLGSMGDANSGNSYISGINMADLDDDGDIDFVGANTAGLYWWENDGIGGFTINSIRESQYNTTNVKLLVADCDNDGDIDILVSVRDRNQIFLYKNDGNANFTEEELADVASKIKTPTYMIMADIVDSGTYDMLVYMEGSSEILRWRKSTTGSGGPYVLIDSVDNLGKMSIGDFNEDGKKDLVVTNTDNNSLIWYENISYSGLVWTNEKHIIHSDFQYIGGLYVTDLDADANMDIIVTSKNTGATVEDVIWCKNDGNGSFTLTALVQDCDNLYSANATDIDGDGDKDIYGHSYSGYHWWENDGDENFTAHHEVCSSIYNRIPMVTDIDGDGDKDFIGTRYDTGYIYYFRSEMRNKISNFTTPLSVQVFDMDNDGNMDIFSVKDNSFRWWDYDDSLRYTAHSPEIEGISNVLSARPVDMDRDGDVDVAVAGNDEIYWLENSKVYTKHSISSYSSASAIYSKDIDGDGDIDIACASAGKISKISWFENGGENDFTEHVLSETNGANNIIISDANNDGYGDILYSSETDNVIAWFIWDPKSESFAEEPEVITESFDAVSSIFAVDMDNDGDIDVVASADKDGKISWWEQTDEGFADHFISFFGSATSVYAADADGDGDMDIMGTSSDNNDIIWLENDGLQNFTKHYLDDFFYGANSVCATDIDGDGALDIIGAAQDDNEIMMFKLNDSPEATATLIDGSEYMPESDIIKGTADNIIGRFQLLPNSSSLSLIALKLQIRTSSNGLYNFKLWESTDDEFNPKSDDHLLGLIRANNPGDSETISFTNYTSGISGKDGCWYFVTCDAQEKSGGDIQLFIQQTNHITLSAGTLSSGLKGTIPLSNGAVNVGVATSINNQTDLLPKKYALEQNYPNPFNPSTKINYALPQAAKVTISVYNVLGQRVVTLLNAQKAAGEYSVTFDASNVSAGIYFYEIKANSFKSIKKMLLVK